MLFDDTYRTIEKTSKGVFRDRGSKFIAHAFSVIEEKGLKEELLKLKTGHSKANHHCWALRLTPYGKVFRINDDGEPAGTAGKPILNTLLSYELTNIALVVVRYFGGTLLGVPGLINAYKCAAEDALNNALIIEKTVNDVYTVEFSHQQVNDVMRIIKEHNLFVLQQEFDTHCSIQFSIRKTLVNQILTKLAKLASVKTTFNFTA